MQAYVCAKTLFFLLSAYDTLPTTLFIILVESIAKHCYFSIMAGTKNLYEYLGGFWIFGGREYNEILRGRTVSSRNRIDI